MVDEKITEHHFKNPQDKLHDRTVQFTTLPFSAVVGEAAVMTLGAEKYGAKNWRRHPVNASVYINAALSHIFKWWDGVNEGKIDEESCLSHLLHARANLGILFDAGVAGTLINDHRHFGDTQRVLDDCEEARRDREYGDDAAEKT